jgi:hypothetical protein
MDVERLRHLGIENTKLDKLVAERERVRVHVEGSPGVAGSSIAERQ